MKKYNLTINGTDYSVHIKSIEDEIADIEVNGTPYSVKINEEIKKVSKTPILVRKDVQTKHGDNRVSQNLTSISHSTKPSAKTIKSPLPGGIIRINLKSGDIFKEGDTLLVMESMKMENNILAERSGTILKVCVEVGQSVLQDAIFFEIE
ncbi:MAG: acetyl-CoA carboxylase biotin carboxyl carrier protein subunit [Paludibacter sp.]|nr:acetyl-CoA carboxylase biotin carboxyl carrier protein subunit [Paludibacter sp.]